MIKAVLIDDERPALLELSELLRKYQDVQIVGMYSDPTEAIKHIEHVKPDAVFTDVFMPQLHGMEAAAKILKLFPYTSIVFITAYEKYAVAAFDLNAIDYLMKPIKEARLKKTIARLREKILKTDHQTNRGGLKICCFGQLQMGFADSESIRWRTEKTKELFAYLLYNEKRSISKDKIIDVLWPDSDYDKAIKQLYNGIYYIRKALAEYGVNRKELTIAGDYCLRIGEADYDVARFCMLYDEKENRITALEEMERLYAGEYLDGLVYDWALFEQERLLTMYMRSMIELSKLYIADRRYDDAVSVLKKAYNHNPYNQNVTKFLLILHRKMGNKMAAADHYNSYKRLLLKEMNMLPDKHIRRLLE
jgi:two-component SAPR family response regulator